MSSTSPSSSQIIWLGFDDELNKLSSKFPLDRFITGLSETAEQMFKVKPSAPKTPRAPKVDVQLRDRLGARSQEARRHHERVEGKYLKNWNTPQADDLNLAADTTEAAAAKAKAALLDWYRQPTMVSDRGDALRKLGFIDELKKLGWPFGGGGAPSTPKTPEAPKSFRSRLGKNLFGEGLKGGFKGSYLRPTRLGGVASLIFAPMALKARARQMMKPGEGYGT